jgi:hypothetical protein
VGLLEPDPFPDRIHELLEDEDAFRLATRAHAEIEQLVEMAVQSLFVEGKLPDELKHLGFTRLLALAIALGLVEPKAKTLVKPLTDLRNDFAHVPGFDELSPERAKRLIAPLSNEIKQQLKGQSPITLLRAAIAGIYLELADAISHATAARDFAEKLLAEDRARKQLSLSVEQITELLAQAEASEDADVEDEEP